MKISDIRFPFMVTRIITGQDANGDPIQTTVTWSSKCAVNKLSTKNALYSGVDTTIQRAEIKFYCLPEREIFSNDVITLRGKTWVPEGSCDQIEEGRLLMFKQLIKSG